MNCRVLFVSFILPDDFTCVVHICYLFAKYNFPDAIAQPKSENLLRYTYVLTWWVLKTAGVRSGVVKQILTTIGRIMIVKILN